MNLEQAARATRIYFDNRIPVFWLGAPGIGKTEGANALGDAMRLPVLDWRANLREPVDARGLPVPDLKEGVTRWMRPNDLPFEGSDHPDEGILFCDELNTASPSMQVVGMQLVHERRIGEHKLKAGWHILAAGNRMTDRAAAQRMPSALANRFAHLDVEPDLPTWVKWADASGIDPMVIAFLRFRPELLHNMQGSDLRAFPTPRGWEKVAKVINAPDDIRQALVAGIVGDGPAAEAEGFIRVFRNLPSIAEIIANPDRIQVSTDPATQYAIATALARKADRKNFDPILRFANRALGPEFSILLCVDAIGRDDGLKETRAFIDWAAKNQEVVL